MINALHHRIGIAAALLAVIAIAVSFAEPRVASANTFNHCYSDGCITVNDNAAQYGTNNQNSYSTAAAFMHDIYFGDVHNGGGNSGYVTDLYGNFIYTACNNGVSAYAG